MEIFLSVPPPFSLFSIIHSHGWIQLAPFEKDESGLEFRYAARLQGGRVVDLHFREAPGGVSVQVGARLDGEEEAQVRKKAAWMLGLEADFARFYALAQEEPKLAHVVEKAQGRILRSATLFEDVVKTILTTNTLWAATIRMNRNLVSQFGSAVPGNPEWQAFPAPEELAGASEGQLRTETRLGYRAPYVLELAQRVVSGELDLETLKYAPLPTLELRKRLMAIKGVGAYAAANLLMLLGHYDHIPVDSWALKMVSNEWYGGSPVGPAEVQAAFERWGEFKGLAYWLWNWS
jgi:3-methyladenine DNA glycosylase/8-oxoguanine DNA glycosylase